MQSENISTPIYVECGKMYQAKFCAYLVSALIFKVNNLRTTVLYAKKMAKYEESDKGFLNLKQLIQTNGLVV